MASSPSLSLAVADQPLTATDATSLMDMHTPGLPSHFYFPLIWIACFGMFAWDTTLDVITVTKESFQCKERAARLAARARDRAIRYPRISKLDGFRFERSSSNDVEEEQDCISQNWVKQRSRLGKLSAIRLIGRLFCIVSLFLGIRWMMSSSPAYCNTLAVILSVFELLIFLWVVAMINLASQQIFSLALVGHLSILPCFGVVALQSVGIALCEFSTLFNIPTV